MAIDRQRTLAAIDRGLTIATWWPGWAHLPRDARDVLFLLGVIGWTVLPHAGHLPAWCIAMTAAVLLWRARLALLQRPLPGRWSVIAVLLVAAALTFWSHGTLLGKDAGVTMLVVLMVLKTLELRARRDALVVFFLGFFLVLTNFLYSQSLAVAAAMLVAVWGLLTALVLAHMPVGRPPLRQATMLAGRAALLGAPIMVVLFVLFPRFGPLWGLPQDAMAKTGLSGSLTLGGVAELALDDTIAFRVRFDGPVPPASQLYWRGPVLSQFDGRDWRRLVPGFPAELRPRAELRVAGAPLDYEVVIEPSRLPSLTLLEVTPPEGERVPTAPDLRLRFTEDLQWLADRPLVDRVHLRTRAFPRFEHGPRDPVVGLRDHLELPPGYNPRTLAWAMDLRRVHPDADALTLVQRVIGHIRAEGFAYTLTPGEYGDERGRHAIDEFWLDRRQGFCEHFATAFVVVMRALDVPARVVTGYQGADRVLHDGWVVVRNSHAHAWAEVWIAGRGWMRVDPTAAVAPERVERSASLRPAPGLVAGALGSVDPELLATLRRAWEGLNHGWNQWVLNYSRGQQFDLLRWLGVDSPDWADLGLLLVALLSAAALAGAGWAAWDRWRQDPWRRAHRRIRERLAELGVAAAAHEAPRTLAQRVRTELGDAGAALEAQLRELDAARYAPPAAGSTPSLRHWQRDFERAATAAARQARGRSRGRSR
ncbi:MAG: transglutaminaseTgpA domain-containing protein [Gammaproteobacteria bacterium]